MAIETAAAVAGTPGAAKVFASVATQIGNALTGPAKTAAIKTLAMLQGYSSYLDETNDRVSTVKTFANPALPVSLIDHFVTTTLTVGRNKKTKLDQDDLLDKLGGKARLVVSATAGHGKSMLMKYLSLSLYENPRGKIPIFIELRHLNRVTTPDILTFINSTYRSTSAVRIEAFRQGLDVGAFALLFDGFDELNHELRTSIEDQILKLSRDYPKISIIVSGRPDDKFFSWRTFQVCKIDPMTKNQVVELINKLEYDRGTKGRFIKKIKKGLYETHSSFLSTPLLAILMLLTFEENANIPDKMHLFYAKAFETLFHKHDAMKEQYDRQRKSGLQIDDFEKVFAVFCLSTYVNEKLEFNRSELLTLLKSSLSYNSISIDANSMLFDLEEAVCLLQKEGTSFFFVHRSFQEYFTAVFLASCPEEARDEFIDQVSLRYWDNVLPMLFDMASAQIEPSWVVSNCDAYIRSVQENGGDNFAKLTARWRGISLYETGDKKEFHNLLPSSWNRFVAVMHRFYPIQMRSGRSLNFQEATKLVNFSSDDNEVMSGDRYRIVTVIFKREHGSLLDCLSDFTTAEYDKIVSIRSSVDQQQASRAAFLQKLFKSDS